MSKRERTPAQKYGWYKGELRLLWRKSPMYWEAYNAAKVRPGVLRCAQCNKEDNSRLFELDHMEPVQEIGGDPTDMEKVAGRLNVRSNKIQALCLTCHQAKSNAENKLRRKKLN